MAYANISAELTNDVREQVQQKLKEVQEFLPFLINLTNDERATLPKMKDTRLPFVNKSLSHATMNPKLEPQYTDITEFSKDMALYTQLTPIFQQLNSLYEMVDDTMMALGSEAYVAALSIYNTAKGAAKSKVPGIDAVVSDLKPLFEMKTVKPTTKPQ